MCLESQWFFHIHFLLDYTIQESCLDIHLVYFPLHDYFQCKYGPNGSVPHHRCKCLFVVYAFFLWESSCYESFLVSHDVVIFCMLDLVDPYGRYYGLPFRSRYRILDIILLELVHSFPFFLAASWKVLHQWCRSIVLHNWTVSEISSLKVSSYYSSSWILYWIVVTYSLEQVSSFFACMGLCMLYFLQVKCICMVRNIS